MATIDLKAIAAAFAIGAAAGGGTVKAIATDGVELNLVWQNDHLWATGRATADGGVEVAHRRCMQVTATGLDAGVELSDSCTERTLTGADEVCWQQWLKCSGAK